MDSDMGLISIIIINCGKFTSIQELVSSEKVILVDLFRDIFRYVWSP